MKTGFYKGTEPTPDMKQVGGALLKILGVGIAAGVTLVTATNKIMTKLTASKK